MCIVTIIYVRIRKNANNALAPEYTITLLLLMNSFVTLFATDLLLLEKALVPLSGGSCGNCEWGWDNALSNRQKFFHFLTIKK